MSESRKGNIIQLVAVVDQAQSTPLNFIAAQYKQTTTEREQRQGKLNS